MRRSQQVRLDEPAAHRPAVDRGDQRLLDASSSRTGRTAARGRSRACRARPPRRGPRRRRTPGRWRPGWRSSPTACRWYSVHASASSMSSWLFIAFSFSGRFMRMTTTSPWCSRSTSATWVSLAQVGTGWVGTVRSGVAAQPSGHVTSGRGTSTPSGRVADDGSRSSAAKSSSETPSIAAEDLVVVLAEVRGAAVSAAARRRGSGTPGRGGAGCRSRRGRGRRTSRWRSGGRPRGGPCRSSPRRPARRSACSRCISVERRRASRSRPPRARSTARRARRAARRPGGGRGGSVAELGPRSTRHWSSSRAGDGDPAIVGARVVPCGDDRRAGVADPGQVRAGELGLDQLLADERGRRLDLAEVDELTLARPTTVVERRQQRQRAHQAGQRVAARRAGEQRVAVRVARSGG